MSPNPLTASSRVILRCKLQVLMLITICLARKTASRVVTSLRTPLSSWQSLPELEFALPETYSNQSKYPSFCCPDSGQQQIVFQHQYPRPDTTPPRRVSRQCPDRHRSTIATRKASSKPRHPTCYCPPTTSRPVTSIAGRPRSPRCSNGPVNKRGSNQPCCMSLYSETSNRFNHEACTVYSRPRPTTSPGRASSIPNTHT